MRTTSLVLFLALTLGATSAAAFHKLGHKLTFPGEPSGKFTMYTIDAGATCTAAIEEPEGLDIQLHGGPKKRGFIGEEHLEVVVLSEDPDFVQVCFLDGEPRSADVKVRVSFEPELEDAG